MVSDEREREGERERERERERESMVVFQEREGVWVAVCDEREHGRCVSWKVVGERCVTRESMAAL